MENDGSMPRRVPAVLEQTHPAIALHGSSRSLLVGLKAGWFAMRMQPAEGQPMRDFASIRLGNFILITVYSD